jgi:translation initiation factor 2 beta subunit (eIF-2beta)/eIF-5
MAEPDFLICLECESPVYIFEWQEGRAIEIVCPVCGNDDPANFATEEELEEMSAVADGAGEGEE